MRVSAVFPFGPSTSLCIPYYISHKHLAFRTMGCMCELRMPDFVPLSPSLSPLLWLFYAPFSNASYYLTPYLLINFMSYHFYVVNLIYFDHFHQFISWLYCEICTIFLHSLILTAKSATLVIHTSIHATA